MTSRSFGGRARARLGPNPPAATIESTTASRAHGDRFDPDLERRIRTGFLETYLTAADPAWIGSAAGQSEIRREIVDKYEQCRRHVVPWVEAAVSIQDRSMIEIGSGTGAKAAAFAPFVREVRACDVSSAHVDAARCRLEAMDLDNVAVENLDAAAFLDGLEADPPADGVGVCLLFAVLEHMTLEERLDTLRRVWALLEPGGVVVVLETPNRLLPWDWHGSRLPFFSMLPDDLALLYIDRSPRLDYRANIERAADGTPEERRLALTREGRGISYHEFAVALGDDFTESIVADSWDPSILALNPLDRDEWDLVEFVSRHGLDIPPAFTRYWIELVLQKPTGVPANPPRLPRPLPRAGDYVWPPPTTVDGRPLALAMPPGAERLVLVTEVESPGATLMVDDGRDGHANLAVPPGQSVHGINLKDASQVSISVVDGPPVTVIHRFAR